MKGIHVLSIVLLIFILVFPACKKFNVPDGFPEPEKMAHIIADLHVLESSMNYGPGYSYTPDRNNPGYYRSILDKYGITSEKFDSIRKWYVDNTLIYQYVYERAIVILSEREAAVRIEIDRERELEKKRLDELAKRPSNLWRGKTRIEVGINDTIDRRLPFRIETDTLEIEGNLRLTALYRFLRRDASKNPQMVLSVMYADSTADTLYQKIYHSFQKKVTVLNMNLRKEVKPISVYGFLLFQDSLLSSSVEIEEISLMVIKDSVIIKAPRRTLILEEALN